MNTELDIDACKQGDRAALEKLYKTYSNKLMRICLYYIQLMKNSRNGTIWFHGEREKNTKLFFYHY